MSDLTAEHLEQLDDAHLAAVHARQAWLSYARSPRRRGKQIPPDDDEWLYLLLLAGRGFGKTRSMTEWMWWQCWTNIGTIGHYVAPTLGDCKGTGFEGPAGFKAVVPAECLWGQSWERAYRSTNPLQLKLGNGSIIRGFGAQDEGGRLRGPQCHFLCGDELREWDAPAGNLEQAINNALFGLRLVVPDGSPARAVFGTTPKPIGFLKRLAKRPGMRVVRGTSRENIENLSPSYRAQLMALEGTMLGRQEIDGAFIDEESDVSIIKRHWINLWPHDKKLPEFMFVLEVYDTAASEQNFDKKKQETDPTACMVFGIFNVNAAFTEAERAKMRIRGKYAALVCEAWAERLGLPALLEKASAQNRVKWGNPGRRPDVVLIEDKSSGPGMRQFMAKWGVPVWPYNPGRQDKAMRLHAVSPLINQGMLFVPESSRPERKGLPRDWIEPVLEQLCAFAGEGSTEHDDFVDCLVGSTGIYTDRGLVPICDIREGDAVLTHKGRFRRVLKTGVRLTDHVYRLKAKGLEEIRLTGNHRVLAMTIAASPRKAKECRAVDWKRADELVPRPILTKGARGGRCVHTVARVIHDGLVLPRTRAAVGRIDLADYWHGHALVEDQTITPISGKRQPIPRHIELTAEAGWVFGLFVAEGCVSGHQIHWNCDAESIQRVTDWVQTAFWRKATIQDKGSCVSATLSAVIPIPLFQGFGHRSNGKRVPYWALQAPEVFVRGFVDGFAAGDGCRHRDAVSLTSVSPSLLFGIRLMLARIGICAWNGTGKAAGPRNVMGEVMNCQEAFRLDYTDKPGNWFGMVSDEYVATHIEICERVSTEVEVFNLSVEEDESYVTVGGTVHNCVSSAFTYLRNRGVLEAKPEREFRDAEDKREREERDAERQIRRDQHGRMGNPYG